MAEKEHETKAGTEHQFRDPRATEPKGEDKKVEDKKAEKKLAVRLLADYWDSDGVRHSASYVDANGETHATGALIELPPAEARALVKSDAAERGDDY